MNFRNAAFNGTGTIDCEIDHPVYGWIPFTAAPDDIEEYGRDIFAAASTSAVPYNPPPPPTPEEVRASMPALTGRQLRLTLLSIGITDTAIDAALADDPAGQIEWKYASYFRRTHPLVDALGSTFSITPEQTDSLWLWASEL